VHYLEWGQAEAPPLVLLHGLTGHARIWDHMAPRLAERYRVLAPDQRGHGDTSAAESYATADFVADLEAMVAHWGLDRFDLVGLSMGGHNAIAYAAAHPERVSRLAVIDIPPRIDRRKAPNWETISRLAETGHKVYEDFEEAVRDARAGTPTAPDENLRYRTRWNLRELPSGGMVLKYDARAPARWAPEDLTNSLAMLSMRVLLVRGGKTTVLPRDIAEEMAAAIPECELVEVVESGHSVPTDRPEELAEIVLGWLSPAAV
jgi:pimeloyl-ACP methyl ester carboxylesterase